MSDNLISRYKNAEAYEHSTYCESLFRNANIYPNWIGGGNAFWYVRSTPAGKEFRLVDAENAENKAAFNHQKLASALSKETGEKVDPDNLPVALHDIDISTQKIQFYALGEEWLYCDRDGQCEKIQSSLGSLSSDRRYSIFGKDFNVWFVDAATRVRQALTTDGEQYYAYGLLPERANLLGGFVTQPEEYPIEGIWSPDSRFFLTCRTDERKVKSLPSTIFAPRTGSNRPKHTLRRYALPEDEHIAQYEIAVVDTHSGTVRFADYRGVPDAVMWASLFSGGRAWWSADSTKAYFIDAERHLKAARVVEFDVLTGKTRVLFEERTESYLDFGFEFESVASLLPSPKTDELIWWSERTGWAHIYLYDLKTGALKNAITSGEWVVREVLHFNSGTREVFIQVAGREKGRDPYFRELAAVNVDTGQLRVIASGDYDIIVHKNGTLSMAVGSALGRASISLSGVSPTSDYFVVTNTRPDREPVTELLDRDGKRKMLVETTDVSGLPANWKWPEPVKAKTADCQTDIYGLIFRPSDFDPSKQYPVVDIAFINPFYAAVPHGAFGWDMTGFYYMSAAALAELGFIVTIIDGRGSIYRSKAFHDHAYGRVQLGSDLSDHIAWLEQAREQRPYMDLNRVGIVDWGGSNGPIHGLLRHGDFYKVGAVASMWDPRLIMQGDIYNGPQHENDCSAPGYDASNLKGKLLLIHGMLDTFFHPSGMFRLIDDLVRANKDFDLVMLPNGGHAWDTNSYGTRRIWDYLVRHLAGGEPPEEYELMNGTEVLSRNPLVPDPRVAEFLNSHLAEV